MKTVSLETILLCVCDRERGEGRKIYVDSPFGNDSLSVMGGERDREEKLHMFIH